MIGDHMSVRSTCASQPNEVDPLPALAELKPVLRRFQKRSASRALIIAACLYTDSLQKQVKKIFAIH
jgi:hypothetical protein